MVEVNDVVREKALSVGADGWLADLPELVASVEREWGITVGRPYTDSTEAFVAEATCEDGSAAVLKLIVPRDSDAAAREILALRLVGGDGCARLLREDVARAALLLERLGRSMYEIGLPIRRRHELLVDSARRMWRAAPDCGLPTGGQSSMALRVHREDVGGARSSVQRARRRPRSRLRVAAW